MALLTAPRNRYSGDRIAVQLLMQHDTFRFTAEISQLTKGYNVNPLGDLTQGVKGFVIVNPRSGNEVPVALSRIEHVGSDEDAEVAAWVFKPTPEAVAIMPRLAAMVVTVFND